MKFHIDTDYLVYALSVAGPERNRLLELADSHHTLEMSSMAWYEFSRGPRTPEHLAVARNFLSDDGIIPFSEELASLAAECFKTLGSPRKRGADIVIGTTAAALKARLLTRNGRDFAGIPDLVIEEAG